LGKKSKIGRLKLSDGLFFGIWKHGCTFKPSHKNRNAVTPQTFNPDTHTVKHPTDTFGNGKTAL
jgi:hypothetical protein